MGRPDALIIQVNNSSPHSIRNLRFYATSHIEAPGRRTVEVVNQALFLAPISAFLREIWMRLWSLSVAKQAPSMPP